MTDIREHPPPATLAAGDAEGPGEGEPVGIETFLVCGAGHEGTDGVMDERQACLWPAAMVAMAGGSGRGLGQGDVG